MLLIVQEGPEAGRRLRLDRGLLTIGRSRDADWALLDEQASRLHAELRRHGDQWLIIDLGSTNGTFLEDPRSGMPPVRLAPEQARPLPSGAAVVIGSTRFVLQPDPEADRAALSVGYAEQAAEAGSRSLGWSAAPWLGRVLALAGAVLLVLGSLRDWIRVQATVPLLGEVLDRTLGGMDSGHAWLFIGVSAVALVLVLFDIASRQWGLAAGLGQALVAAMAAASTALTVYQYYQVGTQKILGISLLDILTEYARDVITITAQPGIYWVGAGLVAVIAGGVFRLIAAGLEPAA
jgi:hypothetical protein